MGAYSDMLPADALRDAAASVYAKIAHRLGWLGRRRSTDLSSVPDGTTRSALRRCRLDCP